MELQYLGIALLVLIVLDVVSIWIGADSRHMSADKREW